MPPARTIRLFDQFQQDESSDDLAHVMRQPPRDLVADYVAATATLDGPLVQADIDEDER